MDGAARQVSSYFERDRPLLERAVRSGRSWADETAAAKGVRGGERVLHAQWARAGLRCGGGRYPAEDSGV